MSKKAEILAETALLLENKFKYSTEMCWGCDLASKVITFVSKFMYNFN